MTENDPTRWQEQLGLDKSEYDPNARRRTNPILDRSQGEDPVEVPVPPSPEPEPSKSKSPGRFRKLAFTVAPLRKKGAARWLTALAWGLVGAMVLGVFGLLQGYGFLLTGGFMFLYFTKPVQSSRFLRISLIVLTIILLIVAYIYSRSTMRP